MGKNRESEIIISVEGDNILWKIDTDKEFEKEVQLKMQEGCKAIVYIDGIYNDTLIGNKILPMKKYKSKTLAIYAVNSGKEYEIKFGFGNIVFHDSVIDDTITVGIHGTCNFKVQDGKKLHLDFNGFDKINTEDIRNKYFAKLQTVVMSKCSEIFENYGYRDVQKTLLELSKIISENIQNDMYNAGILLSSCNVMNIHFPEGYEERFQNKIDDSNNMFNNSQDQQAMNDLRIIRELNNMNANNNNNNNQPQKPQTAKLLCPRCSHEVKPGTRFCPACGAKLG